MVKTIADTIIWYAEESIKAGSEFQNKVSAMHDILQRVGLEVMKEMEKEVNK